MIISWAAALAVRRWAFRLGLVDRPGGRKIHSEAMPTGGGLAIWLGVAIPFAVGQLLLVLWKADAAGGGRIGTLLPESVAVHLPGLSQQMVKLWALLAAGTVLMVLGLLDDLRPLDWRLRLGTHFVVAGAVVACGWRFSLFIDAPWITAPISVFWIVALINAFNMLDNMDGLSAGVAAISAAMLAAVMLVAGDPATHQPQLFVAGLLLVVVGSLLGFLYHNRPPARLFMGDAGSYLVGFLIAAATIAATFAGEDLPKHSVLAPLCVMAVPFYDMVTVIWIRLRAGRSPFEGDKNHFSHRLVDLGMSRPQAVLTVYLATATCGLGALLLHQVRFSGACIILLLVVSILGLVALLERAARRREHRPSA